MSIQYLKDNYKNIKFFIREKISKTCWNLLYKIKKHDRITILATWPK